jgi:hypothetical protein
MLTKDLELSFHTWTLDCGLAGTVIDSRDGDLLFLAYRAGFDLACSIGNEKPAENTKDENQISLIDEIEKIESIDGSDLVEDGFPIVEKVEVAERITVGLCQNCGLENLAEPENAPCLCAGCGFTGVLVGIFTRPAPKNA